MTMHDAFVLARLTLGVLVIIGCLTAALIVAIDAYRMHVDNRRIARKQRAATLAHELDALSRAPYPMSVRDRAALRQRAARVVQAKFDREHGA